jgi:hypothetical protein
VHLQSLKQNTQPDAAINRKIYCFVVQTLLNMPRALQRPSSGARQNVDAASGFRMNVEVEVFSAVVGLSNDDGRCNARGMLSSVCTTKQ